MNQGIKRYIADYLFDVDLDQTTKQDESINPNEKTPSCQLVPMSDHKGDKKWDKHSGNN